MSPRRMLVSAVIPTYNYARYVGRAIDSVLAQTYSPFECVVVDDGSVDDTPTVLARYGDRISMIRQANRGLSAARNAGITAARGDAIALLDADDIWKPEKIAKQAKVLADNPSIAVVGCDTEHIDNQGAITETVRFPTPTEGPAALREIARRTRWVGGSGSGALIRRRVLDEVGLFNETLKAAEDWDMWLRIAAKHRIVNLPEVLVSICRHGQGTFRNAAKLEANQRQVFDSAIERWPDRIDERTRREVRALIAADAGLELLSAGEPAAALRNFVGSLREWPWKQRTWYWTGRSALKLVGI